jgi:hypothetical protein
VYGTNTRMAKGMDMLNNGSAKGERNERVKGCGGNVSRESNRRRKKKRNDGKGRIFF